jgi:hypothetical protein
MNRKGVAASTMVLVISITITLVVILAILGPMLGLLKGTAEAKQCQLKLFMTAVTKTPGIGTVNLPPECSMQRITIAEENLTKGFRKAVREIESYNRKHGPEYGSMPYDPTIQKELLEYELDEAMAKLLRQCWDTAWRGEENFFDEWYKLYQFPWEDAAKSQDKDKLWDAWSDYIGSALRPPVNCLACARVKFDQQIKDELGGERLIKLNEWMRKTPVPADPHALSYWEYTLTEKNLESLFAGATRFEYDVDKPYLVAYARVNVHTAAEFISDVKDIFPNYDESMHPEDVSTLLLIPYEEMYEHCTFVIG